MNGRVICNAGPLIAFSIVGRMEILRHILNLLLSLRQYTGRFCNAGAHIQAYCLVRRCG